MPRPKSRRKTVRLDPAVYAQPGATALLTACTDSRRRVFTDAKHADLIVSEIGRLHGEAWRILGYCVMPDHLHLLAFNINASLLDLMRLLKGRAAKKLRAFSPSPLWQRSFNDHLLRRNEDIYQTLLYMFENPVRAGLATDWTRYPWSGSFQWPEIEPEFFNVRPQDVLWNEVFAIPEDVDDS